MQGIIINFRDTIFKIACIEKMEHIATGECADTKQGQTYPIDHRGRVRKLQVLEVEPELSAECGQDIAYVGKEVIKAVDQLSCKGKWHKDRYHWREFTK